VLNGLSHLHEIKNQAHFAVALIRGLGGNLTEQALNEFAKTVLKMTGESSVAGEENAFNITYDWRADCIRAYTNQVVTIFSSSFNLYCIYSIISFANFSFLNTRSQTSQIWTH
jgi:hypothetical protein